MPACGRCSPSDGQPFHPQPETAFTYLPCDDLGWSKVECQPSEWLSGRGPSPDRYVYPCDSCCVAASVMAFAVLIVEVFILREVSFRNFPRVAKESMILIGGVLVIIMASLATSNFFIQEEVPTRLFHFLQGYISTKIGFLLLLNVFLLILGCLLDIFSSIMIVVPLLLPIAEMYDVNFYHLGIVFLANMQIGYSTPPLGMNLFIASHTFKEPVVKLFRATLPFLAILLFVLVIITYWPDLSLYIVESTGGFAD